MGSPSYHVIHFSVLVPDAEHVQGILYDFGCLGLEEQEKPDHRILLKTYFLADQPLEFLQGALKDRLPEAEQEHATTIGLGDISFRPATFDPFPLTGDFLVVPPDSAPPSKSKPLIIQPGPAFGTGRHETTRLVAEALASLNPKPKSVIDVGTGSGILAILSRKIGISRVDAVEIDEIARLNARENFRLNGVEEIRLFEDVLQCGDHYDAVLANLLTPTILHLKKTLLALLNPGGRLLLSGITLGEEVHIREAFAPLNFEPSSRINDWIGLTLSL